MNTKNQRHAFNHKLANVSSKFVSLLAGVIVTLLGFNALIHTIIFPDNYIEKPTESAQYCIIGTAGFFVVVATAYAIRKRLILPKLLTVTNMYKVQAWATFAIGLIWISIATTSPVADQGTSIAYSVWLHNHDIQSLQGNGYIQHYPYQSGYILFCATIGELFGTYNMLPIRFFNLLMILVSIRAICKITENIFNDEYITKFTIILTTMFFPFVLFTTFIYGNIPSIACCLVACYLQQICIESATSARKRVICGTLSAVSLFFAFWFKPNSLIFLIGIEIIWAIVLFVSKRLIVIAFMVLGILAYTSSSVIPITLMESRIGAPLDDPTPKTAWIAMGLQESPDRAPGWYNNYVTDIYDQADQEHTDVNDLAKAEITTRLDIFTQNPLYAIKFFSQKITSTWAEPTFQSLWISYGGTGADRTDLTNSILEHSVMRGKLHKIYIIYCDILQNIVYVGAAYYFISKWKKVSIKQMVFPLLFLGGFAFHLIWETKSDYVLPYFILLIPYAAAGWRDCLFTKHSLFTVIQYGRKQNNNINIFKRKSMQHKPKHITSIHSA